MASVTRPTDLDRTTTAEFNALVAQGADPKSPLTMQTARQRAIEITGGLGRRLDAQERTLAQKEFSEKVKPLRRELLLHEPGTPEYNNVQARIDKLETDITNKYVKGDTQPTPGAAPAAAPKPPNISTVKDAPKGSTIGALTPKGWEVKDSNGRVIGHAQQ